MSRAILISIALVAASCSATPVQPSPTPTASSTSSPSAALTPAPITEVGDGTHRVGEDIEPGTYRAVTPAGADTDFCYWERLSGFDGTEDAMIANAAGVGPRVVTIEPTDAGFVSSHCGFWTDELEPLPGPVADGIWIVSIDLEPGTYEAEGGSLCYWQRLSGFGGTPEEVIQQGTPDDPAVVEITATDRGFSSSRCGEWTAS